MQPLSKAMRRRIKRLAPGLSEQDIDRFQRERRAAMQAALLEDPLYAEALGARAEGLEMARAEPPRDPAEPERVAPQLGALLQRVGEAERLSLDRKAERALARQGEAARPKRPLPQGVAAKAAARARPTTRKPVAKKATAKKATAKKATAKKVGAKKAAPKQPKKTVGRKRARKPLRRGPR